MLVRPDKVILRDVGPGDVDWIIQRHAELYAEHDGFDASFERLVAEILVDFIENRDRDRERGWIAIDGKQRLGSIFCVDSGEAGVAKLRLFLLEPFARGVGLGQLMLNTCLTYATKKGNRAIRLWTHESHKAACALYARNGFRLIQSKPVRSFGQDLVEQCWERSLP